MSHPDHRGVSSEPLIELARRELDGEPPRRGAARYQELERRLEAGRLQAQGWRPRWVPLAALAAVTLAASFWLVDESAPPVPSVVAVEPALAMEVDDGTLESSGDVQSSGAAMLRFSDGTRVQVEADARVRVESVSARGARLRLNAGRMQLDVVKRPRAEWSVWAGQYQIQVTGTSFTVALEGDRGLSVEMREGAVRVRGPLAPDGLELRAGQRLAVESGAESVVVEPIRAQAAVADAGALAEAPEEPPVVEVAPARRTAPKARRPRGLGDDSWTSRVAAGRSREVLDEALAQGLGRVYEKASLEGLQALSDAARYARRFGVARGALSALRRRFPGRAASARAAFFLGRLEETSGGTGPATQWYDRYLAEEPRGPYAEQALGRKLALLSRQGRAETVAREYLRRFPRGVHAEMARRQLAGGGAGGQ